MVVIPGGWPRLNRRSRQAQGLVAWWPLLGRSSGPLLDFAGSNNGTLRGNTVWSAHPEVGPMLSFDGSGDDVDLAVNTALTSSFSLAAWVVVRSYTALGVIVGRLEGNPWQHNYYLTLSDTDLPSRFQCGFYDSSGGDWRGIQSASTFTTNVLYHLLATWDADSDVLSLYVNGRLSASNTYSGATPSNRGNLYIGSENGGGSWFNGWIGEVRLYDRAHTAGEAYQLYDPRTRWELYRRETPLLWFVAGDEGGDIAVTVADSGTGVDSLASLATSLAIADSGSGVDSPANLEALLSVADNGLGVGSLANLAVLLAVADSGAGVDSLANLAALLAVADSSTGADNLTSLAALLAIADSGAGVDSLTSLAASLAIADSGAGMDNLASLAALLAVADEGVGADGIANLAALLAIADSGTGVDLLSVLTAILISVADTGSGADTLANLAASLAVTDTGAAVDALAQLAAALTVIETAVGTDNTGVNVALTVADTGIAVDMLNVLVATLVIVADSGSGSDSVGPVTVYLAVADNGQAEDLVARLAAALAMSDVGTGVDVVSQYDQENRILEIRFNLTQRRMTFSLAQRSVTFDLL